jgi:mannose PTS system EIID component
LGSGRAVGEARRAMTVRLFLRLFLVQALWNYRTMLGAGLAWVLMPALREASGEGPDSLLRRLGRQAGHFNSHPYLAGFAAGALARMERENENEEVMWRFRRAVSGPLGGLGDRLVWAAWLPTCVLLAANLILLGVPPLGAVVVFLAVYNSLHLGLRWWGVRAGLAEGGRVAQALTRGRLPAWAERVGRVGVLSVGLLAGLLVVPGSQEALDALGPDRIGLFAVLGVFLFSVGVSGRRGGVRWTPAVILGTVGGIFLWGSIAG